MPQNPTVFPAPPLPGADTLLDTLRRSPLQDDQRKQLWDAYHTPGDEKAFTDSINKLHLDDGTKQSLYDMRFKEVTNPPSGAAGQVPKSTKGDVRSTAANPAQGPNQGGMWNWATSQGGKLVQGVKDFAIDPLTQPYKAGARDPLTYATMLGQGIWDMQKDEFENLRDAVGTYEGDPSLDNAAHLVRHTLGQFPLLGPAAVGVSEMLPQDPARAIGQAGALMFGGKVMDKGAEALHAIAKITAKTVLEHPQANTTDAAPVIKMDAKPTAVAEVPVEARPVSSTPMGPINSKTQVAPIETAVHAPVEAHAPMTRSFIGAPNPLDMPLTVKYSKEGYTLGMPNLAFGEGEPVSRSVDPRLFVEGPKVAEEPITTEEKRSATSSGEPPAGTAERRSRARQDFAEAQAASVASGEPTAGEELSKGMRTARDDAPSGIQEGEARAFLARNPDTYAKFRALELASDTDPAAKKARDAMLVTASREMSAASLKPVEAPKPAPVPQPSAYRPKSFDLPDPLRKNFDTMADLKRQADVAISGAQRDTIAAQLDKVQAQSRAMLKQHISALTGQQLMQLRDQMAKEADAQGAQSKAINDLTEATIKNRGVKQEIADLRSTGGPVRQIVDPETGERSTMKPDAKVARGARSLLDEAQGRIPTSKFEELKVAAKPEGVSDQEWAQHVGKLQEERQGLKRKISDAVTIASETSSSLADAGLEEHIDRLKEIEGLLGKYVEEAGPGRRANIPAELDEKGAIKSPEAIKSWTLERARLALGKKLKQMPSDEEFYQEADVRTEKARQLQIVSDVSDKVLEGRKALAAAKASERGGVGEVPPGPGETRIKRMPVPSGMTMVDKAKKAGLEAWSVSDDKPAGKAGWLAPDGKHWIDHGNITHEDSAAETLPDNEQGGSATKDLLAAGWVRKVNPTSYHVDNLDSRAINTIEMSTIRDAVAGKQPLTIDYRDAKGKLQGLEISPGWDNLADAVANEKRILKLIEDNQRRLESGRVPGAVSLAGATTGAVAGAVAGAHIAGPGGAIIGGSVGFVAGFITPAILTSRPMRVAMSMMAPIVRGAGMSLRDFLLGTPQMDVGTPDMKGILAQQEAHATRSTNWIERAKTLPAQIYKGFDPFAYVADRRNMGMLGSVLMGFDKDGKVFRDLTVSDTQSLYVALRNAGGEALGQRAYQGFQYNDIKSDAAKAGIRPALDVYLNLKGYERVHEVLAEHYQDLQKNIQQIQQNLQNPNNSLRETASLHDSLKEAQSMQREIHRKVQSGEATPDGYTPGKISAEYADLQQKLGQQKFAMVDQLAQRAFQSRAHILDLLHSNGLISLEDYLTYSRRGPEYVPMERIMDDLADNKFSSSAKPLHLRHQTVIQQLEGSTRTNVNPWEAFDHADRKAFNQIYRNDAMTQALDLAHAYPQTIGQEFKPVAQDYRAKDGEGIVGHYADGKPQLYAVPKYLSDTMTMLPSATKTALGAAASWLGHKFKSAATVVNIGFQASSLIQHALSSAILPESGLRLGADLPVEAAKFLRGWASSVKSVLEKDQNYREMVRSGGAFGTFQRALDPEYFANPSEVGWMGKLAKGRVLDVAQDLAAGLEDINRVNTFVRGRQAGLNERAAGWQTKQFGGAPDFSRLGDLSQPINQMMMFFNASNQYLAQATSAIRKDPMRVGGLMVAMTAGMIALNSWNSQQKDAHGNDLLRKESVFDRQRYWIIETPWTYTTSNGAEKGYAFKIPKPKIAQLLNPIEDMVNYASGKEDRTGTQQALDSISNVSPIHLKLKEGQVGKSFMQSVVSSAHPVLKTAVEQYSNMNDYGQPIVPSSQQNIDPRYQVGPNTSAVAQRMGEGGVRGAEAGGALGVTLGTTFGGWAGGIFAGMGGAAIGASGPSPRRTDAAVSSMTAGGGAMAESYLNPFFTGTQRTKQMEGPEAAQQIPVVGQLVKRFTTNPMDATEQALTDRFYSSVKRLQQPGATLQFLEKNKPDQVAAYVEEHKDELWKGQMATEMQGRLNDLMQSQHKIENAQGLDEAKRVTILKNIHDVKVQILRTFTGVLEKPNASSQPGAGQGNAR